MKTNMKRHFLLNALLLSAAAATLLAASPARAQSGAVAVPEENKDITIQNNVLKLGTNQRVAATLDHAVDALRQLYPDANIVLEPGLGEIEIGDLVLHCNQGGPDLDLELEALSIASGRKFIVEPHYGLSSQNMPGSFAGSAPRKALLVLKANGPPPDAKPEKKVAAFNLSAYFAFKHLGMTTNNAKNQEEIKEQVERLRHMIADTMEALHPKSEGFAGTLEALRSTVFYPDANLLVLVGSEDDLQAARVVIGALPGMGGGRSSFQQNLTRIRGKEEPAEGMTSAPPAAPTSLAAPAPPQNPALPAAPAPPQNSPQ
jgi:hypothetical protein